MDLSGLTIGGRYQIVNPLGQGGMAVVYQAYDTFLDRMVAIKVIRTNAFPVNQKTAILRRFEREAKAVAHLDHTNIIKVYDYGEHDGMPYLVMQYLPGGSLKARTGKPMPYAEAARLLLPIAQALEYAHQQGIIHRDVKPANILISQQGVPMLSDFGIARTLEHAETAQLTGTGVGVGTPEYMPPEQWFGKPVLQSDIYALGVVLYELITGRKPYTADTPASLLLKVVNDPLPRPKLFVPDLPDEVENMLLKALAKQVEGRYANMGEMVRALEVLMKMKQNDSGEILLPNVKGKRWLWLLVGAGGLAVLTMILTFAFLIGWVNHRMNTMRTRTVPMLAENNPLRTQTMVAVTEVNTLQIHTAATEAVKTITLAVPTETLILTPSLTSMPAMTSSFTYTPTKTQTTPMTNTHILEPGATMVSSKDGMVLVYVPAGNFEMGSNNGDNDEQPVHTVYLDAYWIDRIEVTNAMYAKCVADGKCTKPNSYSSDTRESYYGSPQYADYPVIYVNWNQAKAYCEWAGRRLPTEAEWEKAACGTDGRKYPWGENINCTLANYLSCEVGDTTAVDMYPQGASPYGALDMAGNVWEWVADWYDEHYYTYSPSHNPPGPDTGKYIVIRGGSWEFNERAARCANRGADSSIASYGNLGFRCVFSP